MSLITPFLFGIISAFTPCVAVLFPIILYRFFNDKEKNQHQFLIFALGFIVVYVASGYALSQALTSKVQEGIRLGAGIIFVTLGTLGFFDKINPLEFPIIKNSFLLGSTFAMIVSFNPCTLPYLGVIIASSSSNVAFFSLALFGLGLLAPAVLFTIFGKKVLNITRLTGDGLKRLSKLMNIILAVSGVYMILTIKSFGIDDSYIAAILLLIVFGILAKSFFLINDIQDLFKLKNIFLITGLILLMITLLYQCNKTLSTGEPTTLEGLAGQNSLSCHTGEIKDCKVCTRCISLFSIAAIIGAIGIIIAGMKYERTTKKDKKKS